LEKKKKQFTVYHVFSIVGPQLGVQAVSGQNRITCALRLATLCLKSQECPFGPVPGLGLPFKLRCLLEKHILMERWGFLTFLSTIFVA
jgi:hypothetical protein